MAEELEMKHGWRRALWVTVVVLAIVGAVSSAEKKPAPKPKPLPRLVDVGAERCLPCKMMEPILKELAKEYKGKLVVEVINATKQPDAANKYRAKSYPTQMFFNAAGKELYRHEGFYSKAKILAKFESLGIKLTK